MLVVGQQTLNILGWSLGLSVGVFKAERAQAEGQLGRGGGCWICCPGISTCTLITSPEWKQLTAQLLRGEGGRTGPEVGDKTYSACVEVKHVLKKVIIKQTLVQNFCGTQNQAETLIDLDSPKISKEQRQSNNACDFAGFKKSVSTCSRFLFILTRTILIC